MNSFSSAYPDMDTNQAQQEGRFTERVLYEDAQSKEDYYQRSKDLIDGHEKLRKARNPSTRPDDEVLSPPMSTLGDSSHQLRQTIGPFTNFTYYATGLSSGSVIYKHIDTDHSKVLAVKATALSQNLPPHDSKREARILVAAAHSNIIPLLSTHTLSSQFLLVFPFQPFALDTVLSAGYPLNAKSARDILEGSFRALAHIHSKGIIHRDIKPANILLGTPEGSAFLADFGIAWSPDDPASEPSDQKITDVGTTCYRAPELLFGHKAYGSGMDLWAAGCVVAECVWRGFVSDDKQRDRKRETGWTLFDAGALGSELALVKSIFETLGTPTDETWPEAKTFPDWNKMTFHAFPPKSWEDILPLASEQARDLVTRLVVYQSTSRLTALEALDHVFFSKSLQVDHESVSG